MTVLPGWSTGRYAQLGLDSSDELVVDGISLFTCGGNVHFKPRCPDFAMNPSYLGEEGLVGPVPVAAEMEHVASIVVEGMVAVQERRGDDVQRLVIIRSAAQCARHALVEPHVSNRPFIEPEACAGSHRQYFSAVPSKIRYVDTCPCTAMLCRSAPESLLLTKCVCAIERRTESV